MEKRGRGRPKLPNGRMHVITIGIPQEDFELLGQIASGERKKGRFRPLYSDLIRLAVQEYISRRRSQ